MDQKSHGDFGRWNSENLHETVLWYKIAMTIARNSHARH